MYKDHISETERDGDSMLKVGTLPNLRLKRRALTLVVTALAAQILSAAPTVEIKSVAQRWPWNNKLDITYEVSGGQDVAKNIFRRLVFTAKIGESEFTIDGVHDIGANASNGVHTVTWTAPAGYRTDDCSMSAALYPADAPSGDDYMIVNLVTGEVSYEGLLATQADSNDRYNDGWYKTTNMVFRKVAAGGPYPVGQVQQTELANNLVTNWVTDRAYYIGIYPVTQWQYTKVCGSNPSKLISEIDGNEVNYRPVEYVSWNALRLSTTNPDEEIPTVASNEGTFLQRLNYLTKNRFNIDLPTEIMWEIAARAGLDGNSNIYFWGSSQEEAVYSQYIVYSGNSSSSTVAVGSRLPNGWGIFDISGNVFEWCRDDAGLSQLRDAADPWTPSRTGDANRRTRGGQAFNNTWNWKYFRLSYRSSQTADKYANYIGFRVAWIVK